MLVLIKKMNRADKGLCIECGRRPCECKTSDLLPKRANGKRGKRRFGRNDAGLKGRSMWGTAATIERILKKNLPD